MKFKTICSVYSFVDEQLIRALDPKARLTKQGKIVAWLTREQLDRLETQHIQYRVIY